MGYICTNIGYLYAALLQYEKKFDCSAPQIYNQLTKLVATSVTLTKYAVNKLVLYKAEEEPNWNWTQKDLYVDGYDYAQDLHEQAMDMIEHDIKFDLPYGMYEQPPALDARGYRLVNRFADIYWLCDRLMSTMGEEEKKWFENNVLNTTRLIYSQAESINKKLVSYETKVHSEDVMDKLQVNEDFDYETRASELKRGR